MDRVDEIRERWEGVGPLVVVEDIPSAISTIETMDEDGEWVKASDFLAFCGESDEIMERARLLARAPDDIRALLARIDELKGRLHDKVCPKCGYAELVEVTANGDAHRQFLCLTCGHRWEIVVDDSGKAEARPL